MSSTDSDAGTVAPSMTAGLYCRARIDRRTIQVTSTGLPPQLNELCDHIAPTTGGMHD